MVPINMSNNNNNNNKNRPRRKKRLNLVLDELALQLAAAQCQQQQQESEEIDHDNNNSKQYIELEEEMTFSGEEPPEDHTPEIEETESCQMEPDVEMEETDSDSEQSCSYITQEQDTPLDLSVRGSKIQYNLVTITPIRMYPMGILHGPGEYAVPIVRGDVASSTTKESVATRYNLSVSPVVEEMPPGADLAFVCPICGQMFSLQHRLAKHMASMHRNRTGVAMSSIARCYSCDLCMRRFARSDMLTRHKRLHTGQKPYNCEICGQIFSRSDHLSTHTRTHTGEKPYKCPQCSYAACRRDMITRHLRTHVAKFSNPSSSR